MTSPHKNARLEAFCDGVFAIALTLLVLDVRLPPTPSVANSADLWHALQHLLPTVFAFVLSFGIIFITWVNHHGTMELVTGSSSSFIYANGLLLLTVVALPFPAALLGEFLWTDHASPAVVLYNAVLTAESVGWIVLSSAAQELTIDARCAAQMRVTNRNAYVASVFYALLAFAAVWFPLPVAIITTMSWVLWLVLGVRMVRA